MSIANTIDIRPATKEELETAELLRAKMFQKGEDSAAKRAAIARQIKVRLKIGELVGEPPGHTLIAWDNDKAVGVMYVEMKEHSNPVPGLAGLWALRPLGIVGIVRYLMLALLAYRARHPDEAYLHSLAILPAYRKRGIATRLLHAIEKIAVDLGKTKISSLTANDNIVVQHMVNNLGFHNVAMPRSWWRRALLGKAKFMYFEKNLRPAPTKSHTDA